MLAHAAAAAATNSQATTTTVAAIIAACGGILAALITALTSWRAQSYKQLLDDIKKAIDDGLRSTIDRLIDHIDKRG